MGAEPLKDALDALYAATDFEHRLLTDPIAFPRRYRAPEDIELAALVAASLAYGRVDLFRPVIDQILGLMDQEGGPAAYIDAFSARDHDALAPILYRWNRGPDFILLFRVLQVVGRDHGGLGALAQALDNAGTGIRDTLSSLVAALRGVACELEQAEWSELPRGFRYFLPSPDSGSACKRWNMYLRWMVRSPAEGLDFGIWPLGTERLIIPLDTHVLRIADFVGLTARKDASWRTAEEITASLRKMDPIDPVRYDFAIAHLGISGACLGRRDDAHCPRCPLEPHCEAK